MSDTKPDDALEQSKALKRLLTNLAQNYYDGDDGPIEVRWTDETAHANTDPDGTRAVYLDVNAPWKYHDATGAHALRLLVDTLSHEVQHHNDSKIEGKREFMEQHDDGYAKLAGMAMNILEDNYIDYNRHRKYRGLKKVHNWAIQSLMEDDEMRPPMSEIPPRKQAVEGFTQLAFAGRVKGINDADPEVREALMDIAPLAEQVKQTQDPDRREEMAHEVVDRLREVIPETPDLPDFLRDLIEEIMEDLERGHFDPDEAPDDSDFDPEEAEDTDAAAGGSSADGEDGGSETRDSRMVAELLGERDAAEIRIVE